MKPGHLSPPAASETTTETVHDGKEEIPEGVRRVLDGVEAGAAPATHAAPSSSFGNLAIAQLVAVREGELEVRIGGRVVVAKAAPHLHAAVLKTAVESGEPVLVERGDGGALVVVGALRTQPTPGVDQTEEILLEADRIQIKGRKEVLLTTSGVASLALRAAGEIETYADRIVSRAEGLHKLVGRMLKLN